MVLVYSELYNHHHNKFYNIFIAPKNPPHSLGVTPHFLLIPPHSLSTTDLSVSIICLFLTFHTNGIIQCVTCVWLLWPSIIFSRLVHVVACVSTFLFTFTFYLLFLIFTFTFYLLFLKFIFIGFFPITIYSPYTLFHLHPSVPFIPFYDWVIFHHVGGPHFVYPLNIKACWRLLFTLPNWNLGVGQWEGEQRGGKGARSPLSKWSAFLFLFLKYILLNMLLQFSQFPPPLYPPSALHPPNPPAFPSP